ERWMSKDAKPLIGTVTTWAHEKWEKLQMRPESLIGRFHEISEKGLQQPMERFFGNLPLPLYAGQPPEKAELEPIPVGAYLQLMHNPDHLRGIPEECRPQHHPPGEPGTVEKALHNQVARLGDEMEQKVAELAVQLIEDPAYRLAGAEEGLRQFNTSVEQALQS